MTVAAAQILGRHVWSELMTSDPIVCRDFENVDRVARKIAENHHNHLPVVDAEEHLVGMVTRADALSALVGDAE